MAFLHQYEWPAALNKQTKHQETTQNTEAYG